MNAIEYANTLEATIQTRPAPLAPAPDQTADPAPSPVAREGWGGGVTARPRPGPGGSGFSRDPSSQAAVPSSEVVDLSRDTAAAVSRMWQALCAARPGSRHDERSPSIGASRGMAAPPASRPRP